MDDKNVFYFDVTLCRLKFSGKEQNLAQYGSVIIQLCASISNDFKMAAELNRKSIKVSNIYEAVGN